MHVNSGEATFVRLCPAWMLYGTTNTVKTVTVILRSRADDVIPFGDSEALARTSGRPASALVKVGTDRRLADPEPMERMMGAGGRG